MTRAATQDEQFDHERDLRKHEPRFSDIPFSQRLALSKLVGYAEGIVSSGALPDDAEFKLREIIAETIVVFGMTPKRERELSNA